ncbi:MAG TPA: 23S rRNA (guanosine(2251)-2'-O)-methyltransferase RlmB [Lachnospiraceae bacterium]|nr:23S rRNA (guanosine(2251)-2'-O)-methyltransferase RlmB [Lachnospiraceae bacterium]
MITSTGNAQVKYLQQLQKKGKLRDEEGVFLIEGLRMFEETPAERIRKAYVSETFYQKQRKIVEEKQVSAEILSDSVFERVSATKTPQGILCIVTRREWTKEEILGAEHPFLMILDNLQDPGNLGTILRTAEGAGVTGILMSKDCVDIYNPKVIRSTMGSIYRMPFIYLENLEEFLPELKEYGITSYAAHLEGEHFYDEENYTDGCAFLIGNEGNGLRAEVTAKADRRIRIPMHGQVESLNAAMAAGILMYEVCRQRRK